jgi:N-acetylneuraminic acid mutarotase
MLVAGGTNGAGNGGISTMLATAEYYDQPANSFFNAGSMSMPRIAHTLTALADGTAVVVGGRNQFSCNCTAFQSSVDRYDPVANSWSAANPLLTARDSHTATRLPDGRVLVVGGYGGAPNTLADTGAALASSEIFDPVTGNWTATGSLSTARRDHIAVPLSGGRVLVAGGSNANVTLASAEIYDVSTGVWTPAPPMAVARQSASAVVLANGRVLVVNGLNGASSAAFGSGTGEIYDPVANTWAAALPVAVPRVGGLAVALPDGRVMIVGGSPHALAVPEFYR